MKALALIRRPFKYTFENVTMWLIVLNVFVFFLSFFYKRATYLYLAMNPVAVTQEGMVWQFVTYMFLHADLSHLFFNMLGLYFFGSMLERRLGSREFLLFYLLCGILAGVASWGIWEAGGMTMFRLLGASGAVFAVLLGFATFFPYANIHVFGFIPVRAPVLVLIYTGFEVFSQLTMPDSGVAHLTHLAGFAAAFLYLLIRLGVNPVHSFRKFGR